MEKMESQNRPVLEWYWVCVESRSPLPVRPEGASNAIVIIALYVDHLLLVSNHMTAMNCMKSELTKRLEMKHIGEAKLCLRLEIPRYWPRRKPWLTKTNYETSILQSFGMENCRSVNTPMEDYKTWQKISNDSSNEIELSSKFPCKEAIGSLKYLIIGTLRDPDFVGNLSQFCESHTYEHRTAWSLWWDTREVH